jgi:hypothetical protein
MYNPSRFSGSGIFSRHCQEQSGRKLELNFPTLYRFHEAFIDVAALLASRTGSACLIGLGTKHVLAHTSSESQRQIEV